MSAFRSIDWQEILSNPLLTRRVEELGISRRAMNGFMSTVHSDNAYVYDVIQCFEVRDRPTPGIHLWFKQANGQSDFVRQFGDVSREETKDVLAKLGLSYGAEIRDAPSHDRVREYLLAARQHHFENLNPLEKLAASETRLEAEKWAASANELLGREDFEDLISSLPDSTMQAVIRGRMQEPLVSYKKLGEDYRFGRGRGQQLLHEAVWTIRLRINYESTCRIALGDGS